jgi:hypothetical protein
MPSAADSLVYPCRSVPDDALRYLADQLGLLPGALHRYGAQPKTIQKRLTVALTHLGYSRVTPFDLDDLERWLIGCTLEHDRLSILFEATCGKVKRERLLRSGMIAVIRNVLRPDHA